MIRIILDISLRQVLLGYEAELVMAVVSLGTGWMRRALKPFLDNKETTGATVNTFPFTP